MLTAMAVGMLTGLVTGFFHTKCGIPAILSGILTQLGLWSVNLAIMGMKSNRAVNVNEYKLIVSLRYLTDVVKGTRPFYMYPMLTIALFTIVVIGILYWFFGTELGCSIRATGANSNMARAQGINTNFNKVLGLMIANGLVALSGALLSQYQGFAESNMGRGAIVVGLAAIIIGDAIVSKISQNFAVRLLGVVLGGIIYFFVYQTVIFLGFDSDLLKMLSAIVVAIFLGLPYLKKKYFTNKKREGKRNA